jgi:hypothetical protein
MTVTLIKKSMESSIRIFYAAGESISELEEKSEETVQNKARRDKGMENTRRER